MKNAVVLQGCQEPVVPRRPGLIMRGLQFAKRAARGAARRLVRRLRWPWPAPHPYGQWIQDRLADRVREYPATVRPGLFSILTPVCDPAPAHLRQLAASVFAQDYPAFEWVIIDNGCTRGAVRRLLGRLAADPRVRLVRLPENVGIVRGMRTALEHATGRYVLPVDHDDTLYPDALRVVAADLQARGDAVVLYSDEDKLLDGRAACPFFKPAWDPALFLNCCYVTHLSVIDRRRALELGAYTDPAAEGCPDWDVYCRLVRAGHTPRHVPEILYSWRVHRHSTSSIEAGAKSYAVRCQEHVLQSHLDAQGLGERFEVRRNPLFAHPGMWQVARRPLDGPPLFVNVVSAGDAEALRACLEHLAQSTCDRLLVRVVGTLTRDCSAVVAAYRRAGVFSALDEQPWKGRYSAWLRDFAGALDAGALVATLRDDYLPLASDWAWEALGLLELHGDAVGVCGRFEDAEGKLETAGEVFGYTGLAGSPIVGPHFPHGGYHGLLFCQRSVSVLTPAFHVARAGFLAAALDEAPHPPSWALLGLWLGAHARRTGRRLLYSPHILARRQPSAGWPQYRSDEEILAFLERHGDLLADDPWYARFLSLVPGEGYLLTSQDRRQAVLRVSRSRLCGLAAERAAAPAEEPCVEVRA